MKFFKYRKLVTILLLTISGCATLPNSNVSQENIDAPKKPITKAEPKPFTEKPGEIQFENPTADILYRLLIGELATQRGNAEVASEFYLDAARQSKDPRVASRAVRVADFAEKRANALEAAKIWVEAEPNNSEANRILAVLYIRENEIAKAQEILINLLGNDKDSLGRNILLTGAMLQRETSSDNAEKVSKHITTMFPEMAEAHYIHASLAMQADLGEEALKSIQKCLELKPEWVDAVVLYPRILQENNQAEKAISFLADYIKTHPKDDAVRIAYAQAFFEARRYEDARSQYELLAVKMPNNPDILFALAMLSMQFKAYDEAEAYLMQLEKLGKANNRVLFTLGQLAEQKQDSTKAIQWYTKIHEDDFYLEAQLRIGVILAKTDSVQRAQEHLRSITVKTDNEKRQLKIFEGNLLRDFKQYQSAYDYFSQLLEQEKQDLEYLYLRALVAERLDKVDVVIRDLNYVIENDPENAAALNALGYTLADRTPRLEEALKLITRARELEPNDPAIVDSLGWVQFKLGNHEAALKYLSEAMEKIDDGEVSAHYGEVLWVTGNKEKALAVFSKAQEKFGDNEILRNTIQRLFPK